MYDVYRGAERRVWGVTDQDTAERWIARLAEAGDTRVLFEVDRDDAGEAAAAGRAVGERQPPQSETSEEDEADTAFTPRRVWWND